MELCNIGIYSGRPGMHWLLIMGRIRRHGIFNTEFPWWGYQDWEFHCRLYSWSFRDYHQSSASASYRTPIYRLSLFSFYESYWNCFALKYTRNQDHLKKITSNSLSTYIIAKLFLIRKCWDTSWRRKITFYRSFKRSVEKSVGKKELIETDER